MGHLQVFHSPDDDFFDFTDLDRDLFRFGVFEEQGWEGDLLYPGGHGGGEACTLEESLNSPKNPENTIYPSDISCSLHELLRSPIETEISCNSSSLPTLTKQAVLCEGQSALDVALQHPDFEGLEPASSRKG